MYDANGNLQTDGVRTYTWDAHNRLTSLSGGASGSFTYDALGRRTGKTISSQSTAFLYDGLNPVQELAGGVPVANLLAGFGIDEFFSRTDASGSRSFLRDALGSPVMLTDGSGAVQTQYAYEPYGSTTQSGAASENSFQYTGRENDGTGLYFYRARYYDPLRQRFISEDPIGLEGGINTYSYVRGNPVRWIDPRGLDIVTLQIGISIPFVGGFDVGLLYNTGSGEINSLPDLGVFSSIKKNYAGLGRFKTTVGVSQTLGGRCNFDGTGSELHIGVGDVGGAIGGFNSSGLPTSVSVEVGPQLGLGADLTQTTALTIGDLARGVARLMNGPAGGNWCGCQQ